MPTKDSERIKKFRKACKERILAAFGGACCICGYNRCAKSLALHHLDPKQKDFTVGKSIRAWATVVQELRKCILVCFNCHQEIHDGMTIISNTVRRFDESYAALKEYINEEPITFCPICNGPKQTHQKYCSASCSSRSKFKVNWDKIDLIKELETKNACQLADELGCSNTAIYKRLKKLKLK